MRKTLFIILGIVIILLVLPFALSRVIQSKYEQGIAALNADSSNSGFSFKLLEYQRGWFNAHASVEVDFNPNAVLPNRLVDKEKTDLAPISTVVDQTISNGPVILGEQDHPFTFALAVINSKINFTPEQAKTVQSGANPTLLTSRTVLYFSDATKTTFESDARTYEGQGADHIDVHWDVFNGKLKFPANYERLRGEFNLKNLTLKLVTSANTSTFSLADLNHQFAIQKAPQGFWYTVMADTRINNMGLTVGEQNLFTVPNVTAKFSGEEKSGNLDGEAQINVDKIQLASLVYGPISLDMKTSGINADLLAQLRGLYENKDLTPLMVQQESTKMALALASAGFNWQLKSFDIMTPWGQLVANATVELPKQETPLTDLLQLEKVINADVNLTVAKTLAQQLAEKQQTFLAETIIKLAKQKQAKSTEPVTVPPMPTPEAIKATASAQLDDWVKNGILLMQADNYKLNLKFGEGRLTLNGKPFPALQQPRQTPTPSASTPTLLPKKPVESPIVVPLKPTH